MQFNSIEFLLFLSIVFLLYWFIFKKQKAQNSLIVVSSALFYASWNPLCLILIAVTTLCSYYSALFIQKFDDNLSLRRFVTGANITFNLLILCIFKYFNFFADSLSALLNTIGLHTDWVTLDILLPVGISFYTFQALSYTIDVFRRNIAPTNDLIAFSAYISFFPQLTAGPIERATNLLPQFLRQRHFDYSSAVDGMRQILWGLVKKMLIADNCAIAVDAAFQDYQALDGSMLLLAAVLFAFQIYGDFSGYSDIAVGCSKLLGIDLMQNFKTPYFSRDIAEFWRRWHISLTTWFRDYVYIPLGGSRSGKRQTIRNTFIIFLLSGLWHGANWTFVYWGLYHALLFLPLLLMKRNRRHTDMPGASRLLPSLKECLQMLVTFMLVAVGWIIFRAENMAQAIGYITRMITEFHLSAPPYGRKAAIYVLIFIVVEWLQRDKQHGFQLPHHGLFSYRPIRWSLYYIIALLVFLWGGTSVQFIYFQF